MNDKNILWKYLNCCSNSFLRSLPQQPTVPVFATKSTYTVKYKNVVMDTSHIYADMHK